MKDVSGIFQFPFIAESGKKFSAKWFFNLRRTIFGSAPNEMELGWKIPETSFSCNFNIMSGLRCNLKDEGSFCKIPV